MLMGANQGRALIYLRINWRFRRPLIEPQATYATLSMVTDVDANPNEILG